MPNQWSYDDPPWRDEEILAEAYHGDKSVSELADEWGCAKGTIHRWVDKFDLERQERYGGEWTNREKMLELYWGERLTTEEVAQRLGCTQPTVSDWLNRHGIPTRFSPKEHGNISTTEDGYVYYTGGDGIVWIHQLVAIANGEDPADVFSDGYNTHHKNRTPWDNRPDNIELLTVEEHTMEHYEELQDAMGAD